MEKYTRLAKITDLDMVLNCISDAKKMLKDSGSTQWQGSYPSKQDILNDINLKHGYVFIDHHNVVGYAAVIAGPEPTYQKIDGAWQDDEHEYATIHRICFNARSRGKKLTRIFIADIFSLQYAQGINNFRIDTSRLNIPMQKVIENNGFHYRGIIKVTEDPANPDRLAYELNLD